MRFSVLFFQYDGNCLMRRIGPTCDRQIIHWHLAPILILLSLFVTSASSPRAEAHPLDALSAAEIVSATAIVNADPRTKELRF